MAALPYDIFSHLMTYAPAAALCCRGLYLARPRILAALGADNPYDPDFYEYIDDVTYEFTVTASAEMRCGVNIDSVTRLVILAGRVHLFEYIYRRHWVAMDLHAVKNVALGARRLKIAKCIHANPAESYRISALYTLEALIAHASTLLFDTKIMDYIFRRTVLEADIVAMATILNCRYTIRYHFPTGDLLRFYDRVCRKYSEAETSVLIPMLVTCLVGLFEFNSHAIGAIIEHARGLGHFEVASRVETKYRQTPAEH